MAVAAAAVSLSVGDGGVGLNASTAAAAAAEDLPSNMTEMEMMEDFVRTMVEDWRYQARVSPPSYVFIILLYASLILFGATGNLLVILVVVRNPAMRTARNVFIVNLAVSDLMLCLITMPLTLVEILYQTWQFGDYPAACPVAALLQCTSIFVSTLSITAIALDRRQLIVCPHKSAVGIKTMLACIPVVWAVSLAMASPMAIWKKLEFWTEWADAMNILGGSNSTDPSRTYDCGVILNSTLEGGDPLDVDYSDDPNFENVKLDCMLKAIMPRWLHELQSCKEDFPAGGRLIYSSATMLIQYLLPTITISVAYYQILLQLRARLRQKRSQLLAASTNGNPSAAVAGTASIVAERIENDVQRMKRTSNLLIWVGVMFCVCWLPLNVINTVMDITEKDRIDEKGKKAEGSTLTEEQFCILYAMCHVTSMASACANPVIYGYLNENFNREFKDILQSFRKCMGLDKLGRCRNGGVGGGVGSDGHKDDEHGVGGGRIEMEQRPTKDKKENGGEATAATAATAAAAAAATGQEEEEEKQKEPLLEKKDDIEEGRKNGGAVAT